jgi:hypothetical protein
VFRPVDRHGNIGEVRITDRGVALVVKRSAELAAETRAKYRDTHYVPGWRQLQLQLGFRRG